MSKDYKHLKELLDHCEKVVVLVQENALNAEVRLKSEKDFEV